ncbi:ribose-phosphate diphosphokinase [Stigmatella aurantiaca]|uniref:ribose-phosphate diphosphokinase n=1 Tax=Stigmatella aurantiaca (strain DW4/3-1) TaxID=378806 RepID=Q08RK6_STIAD|nr:ribose-phosphate pyrophosphokinase [Stigmatella aurantiaca]ADO72969.1 ribose-phosphate pyrophosphokinase [Stigmatella aurantiaca DW4/3-1]EAU63123.1 ribose-phosphate pyrophosphokinase [Stigmatella aurantiaca DW4/3-1]
MRVVLMSGSSHPALGESIAEMLGVEPGRCVIDRFPDGEHHVEVVEEVRGCDVYLLQPLGPPVDPHLMELLLLVDACRRQGAARVTAVVPYLAYARQDRRETRAEPLGARLLADLIRASGVDRIVVVDLHSPAVEGCFSLPVEHLSAMPLLAENLRHTVTPDSVIVSPDLGAMKRAERYAALLKLPLAVVHKRRMSGSQVQAHNITGDVKGCAPILVDDMISTAGTIEAAVQALLEAGCAPLVTVVATHSLLVGPSLERLQRLPLRRLLTTDSVPRSEPLPIPLEVVSVAPLLARSIEMLRAGLPGH